MLDEQEFYKYNIKKIIKYIKEYIYESPKKKLAIYGCGDGGHFALNVFLELGLEEYLIGFLDNKNSTYLGEVINGFSVFCVDDYIDKVDCICIAAKVSHTEIFEELKKKLGDRKRPVLMDLFEPIFSEDDIKEYVHYLEIYKNEYKYTYRNLPTDEYRQKDTDTKIVSWYLPQYYAMEYNNRFHGLGFTEWTNSSNAFPQYVGHYQPHIPYDVGYYDLSNKNSIKRQAELANYFGIYGWAIHYYWFDENTQLLDKPLKILFDNKDIDIHFMINWATEDWGLEWDDSYKNVNLKDSFIKQTLPKDPHKFMDAILPIMSDNRYIKIDNKPVFSVYWVSIFEKDEFRKTMDSFRKLAIDYGFPDLYIMLATGCDTYSFDCKEWGGDALVEYQPNYLCKPENYKKVFPEGYINPNFKGNILDISSYIENKSYLGSHLSKKYYRCAVTAWDNTARKGQSDGRIIVGNGPNEMKQWLKDIIEESKNIHTSEEDYVFLSSWNEWAEGSHLEPDMKYGYAWLLAVREAMEGK